MPYVQGIAREAVLQFPPTLDEYVTAENPVRLIDAFVDGLDLQALGFTHAPASVEGRPAYPPGALLKLYLYGYTNGLRSSRKLERETQRNVEVMWLLQKLTPDFKTISDFRKDNLQPVRQVCREFTLLCRELNLFGGELVGIDGSKFQAVNNRTRNFTPQKLERALAVIERQIDAYLATLETPEVQEATLLAPETVEAIHKLARLRERRTQYQAYQATLATSEAGQLSLTDPDSRAMPAGRSTQVAYNVQIAVDAKHKLIVAHEVTQAPTDADQLASMAQQAKAALGVEQLDVLADPGYFDGDQVAACEAAQITAWVRKPHTSVNQHRGLYTKSDFQYDRATDAYLCPAGARLTYRLSLVEHGRAMRYYTTPACRTCPVRSACTRNKRGRRLSRLETEDALDRMAERVRNRPERMRLRKQLVEHPFGTMKRSMQQGYFLLRRLPKVAAEMSLTVLAYNLKRAITLLGVPTLLAALGQRLPLPEISLWAAWEALFDRLSLFGRLEFSHSLARG